MEVGETSRMSGGVKSETMTPIPGSDRILFRKRPEEKACSKEEMVCFDMLNEMKTTRAQGAVSSIHEGECKRKPQLQHIQKIKVGIRDLDLKKKKTLIHSVARTQDTGRV